MAARVGWLVGFLLVAPTVAVAADPEPAAALLFGAVGSPAAARAPQAIGSYAKGCLAGAAALPLDGPDWQVMRPSRHRYWGHPRLVAFIERLADAVPALGWPGLLVGDLAQPRGGPMAGGHASHETGLDVDIWLTPMPARRLSTRERETLSARSVLEPGTRRLAPGQPTAGDVALIREVARSPMTERIFVHPAIKQALCARPDADRAWLAKVRPWWGHDDHIHVRLACPPGDALCQEQAPPPAGDGCGADLAWWLSEEPWRPKPPGPPPKPVTLADLPAPCRGVLEAPDAQRKAAAP